MLDAAGVRRDRLGAVEPVDGRHRVAVHARVLRRRARSGSHPAACSASGRTPTTSAPPTCGRSSPRSCRCFRTARCGWSATADVLLIGIDRAARSRRIGGIAAAMRRPRRGRGSRDRRRRRAVRGDLAVHRRGRRARRRGPTARRCRPTIAPRWSSPGRAASSARTRDDNAAALRALGRASPKPAAVPSGARRRDRRGLARPRADAAQGRRACSRPTTISRERRSNREPRRHRPALDGLLRPRRR